MTLSFLFMPAMAWAWGPITHLALGEQLLAVSSTVLPASVYAIIKAFPRDFLYGSIIPDVVIGKRLQEREASSHSWKVSRELFRLARNRPNRAFALGYQAHLAADTVAHNEYIPRFSHMPRLTHTMLEMKADSLVHTTIRLEADTVVQMRNDLLISRALERTRLSFKTNKRLFRGMLKLSGLPRGRQVNGFIDRHLPYPVKDEEIRHYQEKALKRMIESLSQGEHAPASRKDPLGWRTRQRSAAFAGR